MLEMGDALVVFGVCGAITTAIIKLVPRRNSGNKINTDKFVENKMCDLKYESMKELMEIKFDNITEKLNDTGERMAVVEQNTTEILKFIKINGGG